MPVTRCVACSLSLRWPCAPIIGAARPPFSRPVWLSSFSFSFSFQPAPTCVIIASLFLFCFLAVFMWPAWVFSRPEVSAGAPLHESQRGARVVQRLRQGHIWCRVQGLFEPLAEFKIQSRRTTSGAVSFGHLNLKNWEVKRGLKSLKFEYF